MNNKKKLMLALNKWLYHNNKMREINKYLYDHTELFEAQRIEDYKEELFSFFAGKITRYTKDENNLYEKLTVKEALELKEYQLFGGNE